MTSLNITKGKLLDFISTIKIIDTHEHLLPERHRLMYKPDLFILFSQYIPLDLFSSGLDRNEIEVDKYYDVPRPNYKILLDKKIPLKERWEKFKPYWNNVKHSSYAKSAIHTARIVYGVNEISDETYEELSFKIEQANKQGLYDRIIKDICNIEQIYNQIDMSEKFLPRFLPVIPGYELCRIKNTQNLKSITRLVGAEIPCTLNKYTELMEQIILLWISRNIVGIKLLSLPSDAPNYSAASAEFKLLLEDKYTGDGEKSFSNLYNYLMHCIIKMAAEYHITISIHSGVIEHFYKSSPMNVFALAQKYPMVNFDIFHLGMPYTDEAIFLSKNLPNVFLNFCWSNVISESMSQNAINNILDLVPVNKISMFGGDYKMQVEKIAGHLFMAKNNITTVLASKIISGDMKYYDAEEIIKLWFHDNPVDVYNLKDKNLI